MSLYTYRARPIRAIDGDTLLVVVDHGMNIHSSQQIRVRNVNCPEVFSGSEREAGSRSKDFTSGWIERAISLDPDWPLLIATHKDKRSFNRYVADVIRCDGSDLAFDLIEGGYGVSA